MILLDTNVVSEPINPRPDPRVIQWIDSQSLESLYLPSTALAEWLTGVELLPQGKRRSEMERIIHDMLEELIGTRILPFDRKAAEIHAGLMPLARAKGVVITFADCQIAAIALANDLTVATRDTGPFLALGLNVINPWES